MGSKSCKKLAWLPDHHNLQICRNRKVALICRNRKVAPICARSQTNYQRRSKARQSLFNSARRHALLQRCVIALLTFCQSPHESTNVNVSSAKGLQDVVGTPTTPTTSFGVISDRVGTLPPAEGDNVRETLLHEVNETLTCTGAQAYEAYPLMQANLSQAFRWENQTSLTDGVVKSKSHKGGTQA
ncbi:hypothetical protein PGT21_025013 [Puccinia graminis f. sp. tritici]|uniref:Uncharacterized protein n=1 Tax=Puccinia graminis f. sp. tritici TaxID=56615 RepID=A0A5B0N4L2_PUCGR|nr:hypothetical protein PGT21_025013 [Puccinia graminis f. sp. tritici]